MILVYFDGVGYLTPSMEELHRQLPAIRGDIARMRSIHSGPLKWFERRDKWKIQEHHGLTTVKLVGPEKPPKQPEKIRREYEIEAPLYGLLVELYPSGYALFLPNKENGKLEFDKCVFNNATNKDPLGPAGQPTIRYGWCYESVPATSEAPGYKIEQIKRVDGGYISYNGDSELEECSEIYADEYVWCYEDIDIPYHWLDTDPGPPDPSFCGYTWAPYPEYGGEEADYHTEERLFYYVLSGSKIVAWWPPEFNQYITILSQWNEEGMAYPASEADQYAHPGWDIVTQVGYPAAFGDLAFPGTVWGARIKHDDSRRTWGIIWGVYQGNTQKDRCTGDFPFTSYGTRDYRTSEGQYTPIIVRANYNGVYVIGDKMYDYFMSGGVLYDNPKDYILGHGATYYKREEVIESVKFVPESYPRDPLTSRQLTLMEGNEGLYSYPYYTGTPPNRLYYTTEGYWIRGLGMVSINCGGVDYPIRQEEYCGNYTVSGWEYSRYYTGYFLDYGIFTKENTGVNEENEVVPDEIEPVYCYSLVMDQSSGTQIIPEVAIYGMVLDGEHYMTDEYSLSGGYVNIPELNEPGYYGRFKVRAAIKKFTMVIAEEVEYGG